MGHCQRNPRENGRPEGQFAEELRRKEGAPSRLGLVAPTKSSRRGRNHREDRRPGGLGGSTCFQRQVAGCVTLALAHLNQDHFMLLQSNLRPCGPWSHSGSIGFQPPGLLTFSCSFILEA